MLTKIGVTFPKSSQWYEDEIYVIESLTKQINENFAQQKNLLVNTTWFGPQFDNGQYEEFDKICSREKFDNLFLLAAADPIFLSDHQIIDVHRRSGGGDLYLIGHFDSPYAFNFHSTVLPRYFQTYSKKELMLKSIEHKFMNYNRKPRPHRTNLVKLLLERQLGSQGVITHGQDGESHQFNDTGFEMKITLDETVKEIGEENQWWPDEFGIPHDIHSLGRLKLWQTHFLNVVGETEGNNDVPTFVSEKTWKPIIGLRPFIVNGQGKIYKWLRENGFRTFNHYWKHIPVEDNHDTVESCAAVVQYICDKSNKELEQMFHTMMPDLLHNQKRFYEFSKEQKHKIEQIFINL